MAIYVLTISRGKQTKISMIRVETLQPIAHFNRDRCWRKWNTTMPMTLDRASTHRRKNAMLR